MRSKTNRPSLSVVVPLNVSGRFHESACDRSRRAGFHDDTLQGSRLRLLPNEEQYYQQEFHSSFILRGVR
jgi:hypothetical protein